MASHIVVDVLEGRNFDTANPYITFTVNEKKYKTKIAKKSANPKWNETFVFDKDPGLNEITFVVYDSKVGIKLGISQLRAKAGQFTLALSHPLITSNLSPSSSTSSVASSMASSSSASVPLAQNGMTVIYEDWYKVEREKSAKSPEKEKPQIAEVHLHVEVIPGPMRTPVLESVKSNADTYSTSTYISDDEHDSPELKPRNIERKSIKLDSPSEKSLTPLSSPGGVSPITSPFTSPLTSPLHVPPAKALPTTPAENAPGGANGVEHAKNSQDDDKGKAPEKPNDSNDKPKEKPPKSLPNLPQSASANFLATPDTTQRTLTFSPETNASLASSSSTLASSSSSISPLASSSSTMSPKPEVSLTSLHKEIHAEVPKRKKKKETLKAKVPTRLVESFFVVGVPANLDPIDDRYEYTPAASPVDMIFKGDLLDCFPKISDSFPPHIWMFCLPRGLQLYKYDPGPSIFPFVLTSLDGTRLYGTCLTFYEPIAESILVDMWKKSGRDTTSLNITGKIYAPKCIGTLSRFPFYSTFRDWINEFYIKTFHSASPVPIERYIFHLIMEVPLPIAGGPPVQVTIGDKTLNCKRPTDTTFPLADVPLHLLFEVLDIGNVLTVFSCILQEEKVVFTSSHYSVLTYVCEIFSALMYPFEWVHVYVPILPELLLDFVYSPTPFIMGAHKSYLAPIKEELSDELVFVDLDTNRVHFGSKTVAPFPPRELQQITWELQRVVQYRLSSIDFPGYNPAHPSPPNFIPPQGPQFNEYIRFIFLKFFTSMFQDYRKYLMYIRVFPRPIAVFNKMDFLKSKPEATDFLKSFMETQSFTSFLENHSWPTTQLFDDWLSAKTYNLTLEDISNPKSNYVICPEPSTTNTQSQPINNSKSPSSSDTPSGHTYQHTSFPPLNQELLITSSYTSPPSVTRSANSSPPSNVYNHFKPAPGVLPEPAKSEAKDAEPIELTEEAKTMCTLTERFLNALYDNPSSLEHNDVIHQINDALKFEYGRAMFGKVLCEDSRIAGNRGEGGRLSEAAFSILGEVLHAALREAHANLDLISPQSYLIAITTYHRIANGAQEYLFTKVKSQDTWQNHLFWEKCFFDKVELECKKLYDSDIEGKMKTWAKLAPEEQEKIVNAEENMIFNLVFAFAFNMVNLSLPADTLRRFVTKISLGAALNDEHSNIIMQLVGNMARAKEIEDEALGHNEPKKQDTELKLHFTKQDHYLPIGMAALDESGKGRELFTTLLEEKSLPLVGSFRPLGKKLSLKSKWNEQSAGKYQEFSEERGGYVIKTFAGHKEAVLCVTPGAGGKEAMRLVTGSCDGNLIVWDMLKCHNLGRLEGHSGWVNLCEVETDGLRVLSGSYDRSVKLWDLVKMQKVRTMRGHKGSISCLKAGVGRTCMSASYDNTLMLWDYRHQKSVMSFVGHQGPVVCMLWDENRLVSGSRDTTVRTWDIRTGKSMYTLTGHSDWIKCLEAEHDLLLSGSCDGRIKVWSLDSGQCQTTLHGHSGSVNDIKLWSNANEVNAVSPKFITASADSTIKVWDTNYAGCYQTLQGHTDEVVACSPFLSNCVASASFDGNIRIWDPEQGKSTRTIAAHTHRITTMGVYDHLIATGSWDKTAKVCEFGVDFRV